MEWYFQQSERESEEGVTNKMMYHALELGCRVHAEKYVPFGAMEYQFLHSPCVVYGGLSMVMDGSRVPHLKPFSWFTLENFKPSTFLNKWSGLCLTTTWQEITLRHLLANWNQTFDQLSDRNSLFVKPDDGHKTFSGLVVGRDEKEHFMDVTVGGMSHRVQLIVASPSSIEVEYRFLIRRGQVITASKYKTRGHLDVEVGTHRSAWQFAERVALNAWQPEPIYVLDVCGTTEGKYRVVEIGPVNAAGMYKMDLAAVVKEMTKEAMTDFYVQEEP